MCVARTLPAGNLLELVSGQQLGAAEVAVGLDHVPLEPPRERREVELAEERVLARAAAVEAALLVGLRPQGAAMSGERR